ncbi:MAG: DUF5680 domain-containing protein [Patescibacteria group bacterium]
MNEQELIEFIHEAGLNTYLKAGVMPSTTPHRPGSEEFSFEKGEWKYLDSYAWDHDGGGEEFVYYNGKVVWVLNYYGFLIGDQDKKEIYGFLHDALRLRHPVLPVRGDTLVDGARGLRYEIEFAQARIGNFVGTERIFKNEVKVYEAYVHGGLVR